MKKFLTMILSLVLLLSATYTTAYATDRATQESLDEAEDNYIFDLEATEPAMTLGGEVYSFIKNKADDVEIDLSTAVQIADFQQEIVPYNSAEDQPPVADTGIYLLNPESLKDGQYTTDTQFLIPTRLDGVDVCYDPRVALLLLFVMIRSPRAT